MTKHEKNIEQVLHAWLDKCPSNSVEIIQWRRRTESATALLAISVRIEVKRGPWRHKQKP